MSVPVQSITWKTSSAKYVSNRMIAKLYSLIVSVLPLHGLEQGWKNLF